jgi:TetR/AcrR family transcriptional regulator, mexJK operon transcriptional repressor
MPQPRPITRRPAIISGRATKPPQAGTVADLHPFTASAAPDDVVQDLSTGDGVEDGSIGAAEPPSPRRGGRPSREQAALLGDRILDAATDLFLAEGYGATSIEAVAQRARISKRTFYHRFPDKAALFGAVVHRIIQGVRPPPDVPLFEGSDLGEVLHRLARLGVHASVAPMTLALSRLMLVEAQRFPELAAVAAREGSRIEAVRQIAAMLERASRAGRVAIDRPEFAAEQFLALLITVPQRRALGLGAPMTGAELDCWADDCVNLFLNGCRHWQAGK